MMAEDDGAVRSVLRAFDLLALFTERRRTWAVKDLTAASGLAKTTVLRLVATCEQRGLLWTRPDGRVTVGPGMLRWAQLANTAWQLPEPVRQVLRELAGEYGETVGLYVRGTEVLVCVAQQEGTRAIRHVGHVGDELPLGCGAAGRVLAGRARAPRSATASRSRARPASPSPVPTPTDGCWPRWRSPARPPASRPRRSRSSGGRDGSLTPHFADRFRCPAGVERRLPACRTCWWSRTTRRSARARLRACDGHGHRCAGARRPSALQRGRRPASSTSSCSTSACPTSTASRSAAGCGPRCPAP